MNESSYTAPLFPGAAASVPAPTGAAGTVWLPEWLGRRAADMPDRPALIVGGRAWSYADLDAAAGILARQLAARGLVEGDRVAVLLRNGPHFVCVVHALIRLGAVLVPMNLRLSEPELLWQVERARVRMLIHDQYTSAMAASVAAQAQAQTLVGLTLADNEIYAVAGRQEERAGSAPAPPVHEAGWQDWDTAAGARRATIDLRAIHCMMYTSGTTGRPKAVLLSYGNHWWGAMGSALNLGLHADDRWLACLPLFHIGGLSILLRCAIYGIPVVFPESPAASFDPVLINATIIRTQATIISVVSAQLQPMLDAGLFGEPDAAHALRCVLLGGGPAPRPLLEECARRAIPVVQSYGLTEACSQVATLAPGDALRKLGAAGRPLLPTELRIIPADRATDDSPWRLPALGDAREQAPVREGDSAPATAGTVEFPIGEILVRGPTVTPGYLMADGEGAAIQQATDAQGWLHTGDLGYLDQEGYLYVLDRRSDLIISGGENVYPAEVEAVLLAHPAVAEAGVFGISDPVWGQRVAAVVVPRPGTRPRETELIAFCGERLARFKVPVHIERRRSLPRNASGKLLRRELARAASPG